ncbi:MAG: Helix-turn-helix domain [Acidobacteriota bacterium]|jgi:excisionase family DNA binding protein|nr:Helix-turn-helix domain [Acidobacteriota bacterium]
MKAEDDKLLSTAEAAGQLGVSRQRVLELIGEERLPAKKVGRAFVVRAVDVAKLELRSVGRPPSTEKAAKKDKRK